MTPIVLLLPICADTDTPTKAVTVHTADERNANTVVADIDVDFIVDAMPIYHLFSAGIWTITARWRQER